MTRGERKRKNEVCHICEFIAQSAAGRRSAFADGTMICR